MTDEEESEDVSGEEDDLDDEDFGKRRSKPQSARPSPHSARPLSGRRATVVSTPCRALGMQPSSQHSLSCMQKHMQTKSH